MATTYVTEVKATKQYVPNVVIKLGGTYFGIRNPDSGLSMPFPYSHAVQSLILNPTKISPKQVNTSIASTSFGLLDKGGAISRLVGDRAAGLIRSDVEIYLGRTGVGMDFADYYRLPVARLSKCSKVGPLYSFATLDMTDYLNVPIYQTSVELDGDIIEATSIIRSKTSLAAFPASGYFRLESEIIFYGSRDDTNFYACARGSYNTVPAPHADTSDIFLADIVTGNPLTILLQLIMSKGGGGAYDSLQSGAGLTAAKVDVAGIEAIRDSFFSTAPNFSLALYNQSSNSAALSGVPVPVIFDRTISALQVLEKEILAPCNLRFSSSGAKLSVVLIDRSEFVDEDNVIDADTMTQEPQSDINATDVQNVVQVDWNYHEADGQFYSSEQFTDAASVATYGLSASPLKFQFKGVTDRAFVAAFAQALLDRYVQPTPNVSVKVQMDKSLLGIGDKASVETTLLANEFGELNFASTMEIVSNSINWQTGEVTQQLVYTSFTGLRLGYVAPSDDLAVITTQSDVEVSLGRGAFWRAGWKVRLWDRVALAYTSDATNEIASVVGDEITFVNAWTTTLDLTKHTLSFPNYDEATHSQRRYAFADVTGADFTRTEKAYIIVP